jgi:hypothetical protein
VVCSTLGVDIREPNFDNVRLTVVPQLRRLPAVLSVEGVTLLLQTAPGPKYKAALATFP